MEQKKNTREPLPLAGWPKRYLIFGGVLLAATLAVLMLELPLPGVVAPKPATGYFSFASADGRVDINTANLQELQLIEGIGPVKAQRIVDYREAHGPFHSVEELAKVEGISEKTVAAAKQVAVAVVP